MLDEHLKRKNLTWRKYSEDLNQNPSNFKRKITQTIERLNKWLEPLGLEVGIKKKKK